jgi:hypothetical protein
VLTNQGGELARHLGVAAERQSGLHQLLERGEPHVLEPSDLTFGERLAAKFAER